MSYTYNYLEFEQPAGTFFLTIVPAKELLSYYEIRQRKYVGTKAEGTQREDSKKRIKEIAKYVTTFDATFPTAIILAAPPGSYKLDEAKKSIEILNNHKIEVIDGQHRVQGLEKAVEDGDIEAVEKFILPCVFILEPENEEKAFIFATINGKQTKVNASVVYDLFGVSSTPDPYNILHTLARTLNFKDGSPFKDRLKMLGKKSDDKVTESLTQGTFVQTLLGKMSGDPDMDRSLMKHGRYDELPDEPKRVLRDYMKNKKSDLLVSLFENIFNAVKKTWPEEWENHNKYILSKTAGYNGIMKGIDPLITYGKQVRVLTEKFFLHFFELVANQMKAENVIFTREFFPPGEQGENNLRDRMRDAYNNSYPLPDNVLNTLK